MENTKVIIKVSVYNIVVDDYLHVIVYCMHATVAGRSIGLHRSSILDPNAVLFSCAAIELVQVNDPEFDVIMAFPESTDFERQD